MVVAGVSTLGIQLMVVTAHWILVVFQCFNTFIYAKTFPLDSQLFLAPVALLSIESALVEMYVHFYFQMQSLMFLGRFFVRTFASVLNRPDFFLDLSHVRVLESQLMAMHRTNVIIGCFGCLRRFVSVRTEIQS